MTVRYMPSVAPVAYPAFYRLCDGRLPDTFGEWRFLEDQSRRELVAVGDHVIGVCVAPADLRDHCRSMNCQADGVALSALAANIGVDRYERRIDRERGRVVTEPNARRAKAFISEDSEQGLVAVEDAPRRRRHWWEFWRPRGPARPLTTDVARA
jgi:hypothetical protein